MEIAELIELLEGQGAILTIDGDRVRLRTPADRPPTPEVLERLRCEKQALLTYLRARRKDRGAPASEPALVGIPAPPNCPVLPKGVKLIRYEPKTPPVAIDVCSLVTDVRNFICTELIELDARLHSPVQIRAGHGVFMILERLRQVGLELEIQSSFEFGPMNG